MGLPAFRMTTARSIGIIALIAVGLVPLSNPTRAWLGCLMYPKFSIVVAAAFLARYGRDRDWWFGFSVCGSAYILLCVPGLWNAVTYGGVNGELNSFDLTGKAGELIASLKSDPEPGRVYNFLTLPDCRY